jgi:hypothetical protein
VTQTLAQLVGQLQPLLYKRVELDPDAAGGHIGGNFGAALDADTARWMILKIVPKMLPVEVYESSNLIAIRCRVSGCRRTPKDEPEDADERRYHDQLSAQLDDPKMKEYVRQICALPQPERAQKGSELYESNKLVAECAFDGEHPGPKPVGLFVVMRLTSDPGPGKAP